MKSVTARRSGFHRQFSLLAATALSLFSTAFAEESLRYAVLLHDGQDIELIRDELRDAPADFFKAGQTPFASNGAERSVQFVGTIPIEGKQQAEVRQPLGEQPPLVSDVEQPYVSIAVRRAAGNPPAFTVNVEILQHWGSYVDRATRYMAKCQTPARPNAWQEVTHTGSFSIWQYYTPSEYSAPSATETSGKVAPLYRLDIRLGQLSRESLDKLPGYEPEHRALIAEMPWWREIYSIPISPGVPFSLSRAFCQKDKLSEPDHEPRCTSRVEGSLDLTPSHLVLKLGYQNQAQRKQDRRITPLGDEMIPDTWYFQPFQYPTPVDYPVEGAWCETTWAERTYSPCTNIAAYRLTKISPEPVPSQP